MHPGVTQETFAELHEGLAKYFLKALTDPGSPVGLIKEAREFLKDNKIEGTKVSGNSLDRLSRQLPDIDCDEPGEVPLRLIK